MEHGYTMHLLDTYLCPPTVTTQKTLQDVNSRFLHKVFFFLEGRLTGTFGWTSLLLNGIVNNLNLKSHLKDRTAVRETGWGLEGVAERRCRVTDRGPPLCSWQRSALCCISALWNASDRHHMTREKASSNSRYCRHLGPYLDAIHFWISETVCWFHFCDTDISTPSAIFIISGLAPPAKPEACGRLLITLKLWQHV